MKLTFSKISYFVFALVLFYGSFFQNSFSSKEISTKKYLQKKNNSINFVSNNFLLNLTDSQTIEFLKVSISKNDDYGIILATDHLLTQNGQVNKLDKLHLIKQIFKKNANGQQIEFLNFWIKLIEAKQKSLVYEFVESDSILQAAMTQIADGNINHSSILKSIVLMEMASNSRLHDLESYHTINKMNQQILKHVKEENDGTSLQLKLKIKAKLNDFETAILYGKERNCEKQLNEIDSLLVLFPDRLLQMSFFRMKGDFLIKKERFKEATMEYKKAEVIALKLDMINENQKIHEGILACEKANGASKSQLEAYEELISIKNQIKKYETQAHINYEPKQNELVESNIFTFESTLIYLTITFLILFGKFIIDRWISKKKEVITFSNNPLIIEMDEISIPEIKLANIEKEKKLYEIAKNEPNVFFNLYIKSNPKFYRKLSEKLIDSEIEICAFTKLNFDTKYIARLKDVSVRSVEGKKYRIRKKMQIDPSIELVDWLRNNT